MSALLVDYPFADRLYPCALAAIEHLRCCGPTVILSDGDVVFQPRKIQHSGLWDAVEGRVLIYIHKERMLMMSHGVTRPAITSWWTTRCGLLAAMKRILQDRLTTVFPRQGHYALDPRNPPAYPPADLAIERIGDLLNCDLPALFGLAKAVDGESETP